jgi:hypothetical protein
MADKALEEGYPGVKSAYDFVGPSYQLMAARFEAADNRLSALLTLVSSVTLGVPLLARTANPDISFTSSWFRIAITTFILSAVVGVVGRVSGGVELPNPAIFYNRSLHLSEWEFQKDALYFAGEAFKANASVIQAKGNIAFLQTVLWLIEVLCLVTWLGWG